MFGCDENGQQKTHNDREGVKLLPRFNSRVEDLFRDRKPVGWTSDANAHWEGCTLPKLLPKIATSAFTTTHPCNHRSEIT